MKSRIWTILSLLLVVAFLATACGAPGAAKVAANQIADHYSATVAIELNAVAQFKASYYNMDQRYKALVAKYQLLDQCYVNFGQAAREMMEGRYDTNAGSTTEAPSGVVDMPAAINAFVVIEDTPVGLELCNEQLMAYGDEVTAWRLSNIDFFTKLWDIEQDLATMYYGEIARALGVKLLEYVGVEFMKTDLAQYFAPPKIWYPTFNLKVSIYDRERCDAYAEEYAGQAYWSNASNECKLIGSAAYDVIFRPPLSQATRDVIDTGVEDLQLPGQQPTPSE